MNTRHGCRFLILSVLAVLSVIVSLVVMAVP
jgi:hypothetical protein